MVPLTGRPARESADLFATEYGAVLLHPETGEKLAFFNAGTTTHIPGLKEPESQAILDLLFHEVTRPEYQVRFRWQPDSIEFWDNRSVQHIAMWDYFPQTRSGFRVTIKGDRSV